MKTFPALIVAAAYSIFFIQSCPAPWVMVTAVVQVVGALVGVGEAVLDNETKVKRDIFDDVPFDAPAIDTTIAGRIDTMAEVASMFKRQNGVPKAALNQCKQQLRSATVRVSRPARRNVRFDGVPSACMTLTNVLIQEGGPRRAVPTPMGSAAVQYSNLGDGDYNTLVRALRAKSGA